MCENILAINILKADVTTYRSEQDAATLSLVYSLQETLLHVTVLMLGYCFYVLGNAYRGV